LNKEYVFLINVMFSDYMYKLVYILDLKLIPWHVVDENGRLMFLHGLQCLLCDSNCLISS